MVEVSRIENGRQLNLKVSLVSPQPLLRPFRVAAQAKSVLVAPILTTRKEQEWARMDRTIAACAAQRVHVLVMPRGENLFPDGPAHVQKKLNDLETDSRGFKVITHNVDLLNIESTLAVLAKISVDEEGNDVFFSLGSGSAPGAIAGTIACLMWGWEGVYVGATPPNERIEWLPGWLRIERLLSDDELRVLSILEGEPDGLNKKALLERLKGQGRIRADQDKHAYRRLSTKFLTRLQNQGFVTVGPRNDWDGRHHYVQATDEGRRALRVFGPTLREPKASLHLRGGRSRKPKEWL
jgi:hypothetical protein